MPMTLDPNAVYRSSFIGARPMSGLDLMMMQAAEDRRLQSSDLRLAIRDRRLKESALAEEARQANMANQRFYDQLGHDAAKTSFLADQEFGQRQMGYDFQAQQGAREAGWQADRDARLAGFQAERDAKYQQFLMSQDEQQQSARLGELEYRRDLELDSMAEERRQNLLSQGYDYTDIDRAKLTQLDTDEANLRAEFSRPGSQIREKAYFQKLSEIRQRRRSFMPKVPKQDPVEMARQKIGRDPATGILFSMDHKGDIKFQMPPKTGGSDSGFGGSGAGAGSSYFKSDKGRQYLFDKAFELHKERDIPMSEAVQRVREAVTAFDDTPSGGVGVSPAGPQVPPEVEADMQFLRDVEARQQRGIPIQNPETQRQIPIAQQRVSAWMQQQQAQGQSPQQPVQSPGMAPQRPPMMSPQPGMRGPVPGSDPFATGPVGPQSSVAVPDRQRSMLEAAIRSQQGARQGDVTRVIPDSPAAREAIRMMRARQQEYDTSGAAPQATTPGQPVDQFDADVVRDRQQVASSMDDPVAASQASKLQAVRSVAGMFLSSEGFESRAMTQPPLTREQFEGRSDFEAMLQHVRKTQPIMREELYQGYLTAVQQAKQGKQPPEQIPGEMTPDETRRLRGQSPEAVAPMDARSSSIARADQGTLRRWQQFAEKQLESGDDRAQAIVGLATSSQDPEVSKAAGLVLNAMESERPPKPGTREYYLLGEAIRVLESNGISTQERKKPAPPNPVNRGSRGTSFGSWK